MSTWSLSDTIVSDRPANSKAWIRWTNKRDVIEKAQYTRRDSNTQSNPLEKQLFSSSRGAKSGAVEEIAVSDDRMLHLKLLAQMILALNPSERVALSRIVTDGVGTQSGAVKKV